MFWYNKTRTTRGQTDRMQLSLGGRTGLSEGNLLHAVLDDVHLFSPALTTSEVYELWAHRSAGEVMCAPRFSVVSMDGGEMQQSSLSQGGGEVAGPGAGALELTGSASGTTAEAEEPVSQSIQADPAEVTTDAPDGAPASEPGADVDVASAIEGGFF